MLLGRKVSFLLVGLLPGHLGRRQEEEDYGFVPSQVVDKGVRDHSPITVRYLDISVLVASGNIAFIMIMFRYL